jgi:hypothetical protein
MDFLHLLVPFPTRGHGFNTGVLDIKNHKNSSTQNFLLAGDLLSE